MTLELTQIIPQIEQAVRNLRDSSQEHARRLQTAIRVLSDQSAHLDQLKEKLKAARTTWLVAGLTGGVSGSYPLPSLPTDFSVLGVDGSNIDFDRHSAMSCYLLNMGVAHLRYGQCPEASLESYARLYSSPEDLVLKDPHGTNQEQPVRGPILGIKRSVEECATAAWALKNTSPEAPTVALLDGTLIFWALGSPAFPDFVTEIFLEKGFLRHLDELHEISLGKPRAVASYISYPGGTEVVNVLRVATCPFSPPDCDRYCNGPKAPPERPCAVVAGIQDRELFQEVLKPGYRSELFASRSSIVDKHYREHKIQFFYLNVGEEIGRIEIPQWVAENEPLLNLTHSAVFDQCRRGMGYPVALQEAHEKAVITGGDREAFWSLISQELMHHDMEKDSSRKNHSKRLKWL